MSADFTQDPGDNTRGADDDLDERVEAMHTAAYAAHGYTGPDDRAITDKLVELALEARCDRRKDREKIAKTRRSAMERVFPQFPSPGQIAEQDDPDAIAAVYSKLDSKLFRMLGPHAGDQVQQRLNGEHGVWLCRTTATVDGQLGFYTTRDWACLAADFTTPAKAKIENAVKQMGRDIDAAADRVPEHSRKLKKELTGGVKAALEAGVAPITARIEAQNEDSAAPADESEDGFDALGDDDE